MFVAAVSAWFPEEEVVVLCSPKARERNAGVLREALPNARLVEIPNGETDEENWDLFQIISETVPEGERVVFDVTHGFRSMPLVGVLTLAYLRAARAVQVRHVLYGAFLADRSAGEATPAFDLTPFVRLLDWAEAAGRFGETGDARKLTQLMMDVRSPLNAAARHMKLLSEALSYNRHVDIGGAATDVLEALREVQRQEVRPHQRPFRLVVEQVERTVAPLAVERSAGGLEVLQGLYRRVMWYAERDHYVQAVSLAREWMLQAFIWFSTGDIDLGVGTQESASRFLSSLERAEREPRAAGDEVPVAFVRPPEGFLEVWAGISRDRDVASHHGVSAEEVRSGPAAFTVPPVEFLGLWKTLSEHRNDLAHHGVRVSSSRTARVRDESRRSALLTPGSSRIRQLGEVAALLGIEV
ncbi:hypothetical protein GCM10008939_23430 [Deinococcus aquiradiocola]|uniref:CRISPR-associated protein n=1 Tax=Deinococcus aquiradiocola TaxID=393059 RepID=A0A917URD1_9DEIO|nr:hypothetical protein GCM10008939_23430 [Deinococcus aquiradiocola]